MFRGGLSVVCVCVCVCLMACNLEISTMRRPKRDLGCSATEKNPLTCLIKFS